MSVTFVWRVQALECVPELNGRTNIVSKVVWNCTGTADYNGTNYQYDVTRATDLPYVDGQDFVEFSNLTEAQVIDWVWASPVPTSSNVKDRTESDIYSIILSTINPPTVNVSLPWTATPAE